MVVLTALLFTTETVFGPTFATYAVWAPSPEMANVN